MDGAGNQERFDAHVQQTRQDAGGAVGVQRTEDQVAGQGGLDRQLGGFFVADLADHHDIGVLAQDTAQAGGKGQPDSALTWIWLMPSILYSTGSSRVTMLMASFLISWSRAYSVVDLPEPVGPRGQNHAVGLLQTFADGTQRPAGVAHVFQLEALVPVLSSKRITTCSPQTTGADGDTQVDLLVVDHDRKLAVLRHTVFVNF